MQLLTAVIGGILTFLSPCILPLVPLYLGYLGATLEQPGRNTLRVLPFIIGFTLVFLSLGLTATGIGHFLLIRHVVLKQISGGVLIILGTIMSGLLPLPWFGQREYKMYFLPAQENWIGAILLGMAFALGWTPCTGPILASILLYAGAANTMAWGAILLAAYALGIGLPIMATAYFSDRFLLPLLSRGRLLRYLQIGGGLVMTITGFLILVAII